MRRYHPAILYTEIIVWGVLLFTILGMLFAADIVAGAEISDKRGDFCARVDTDAPVLTLVGDNSINLTLGAEFVDPGVEVADYCDVEQKVDGEVNSAATGEYKITYTATDERGNIASVERVISVHPEYRGTIYLTFDDGPGVYTSALLDILKKYNVKATFFVTGVGDDDLILREYQEGHTVGLHTWSHDYAYIYQNLDTYFADLARIQERVKNITGEESHIIRFPGGSSNTVSARYDGGTRIMSALANEVEKRGYTYFDWNISSGDAGGANSSDAVYYNVVERLVDGGSSVILQHDIKGFSVDAVEGIIKYGLDHGFVFERLTKDSFTAHHGINN